MTTNKIHFVLYTEDMPGTEKLINTALGDRPYTLVRGDGIWSGQREASLQIHVIVDAPVDPPTALALRVLVAMLKETNKQECVLIESWPVRAKLF